MRTLTQMMSMRNLPLLPSYFFGSAKKKCASGKNHYMDGKKWKSCSSFGQKKSVVFSKKHISSMEKKLKVKGTKAILTKVAKILKSKKHKLHKWCVSHVTKMAKRIKVTGKTPLAVWKKITALESKNAKNAKNVKKVRKNIKKKVSSTKIMKGKKLIHGKRLRFGSWWDNTQPYYTGSGQSDTLTGNPYPFYNSDDWTPYYSLT